MAKKEQPLVNDDGVPIKPGINEAVGASSAGQGLAKTPLSDRIQAAMSAAITAAYAEGITDADVHRERMQKAREEVKALVRQEEADAAQALRDKADAETAANIKAREAAED